MARGVHLSSTMPLWSDLVYATRRLLSRPAYCAIALATLALGVGLNATIFTFVNGFLLRPLPVADPGRLFTLSFGKSAGEPSVSYPTYLDIRDRNQVFSSYAALRVMPMALSRTAENARIWGYLVSGNYFDTLGIRPFRGRFIAAEDDGPSPSPVAVLSYTCWQQRFGADPNIIGQSAKLNGERFTIIGIAPPGFIGTERLVSAEIWVPFSMIHTIEGRDWRTVRETLNAWTFARLKPGISPAGAEASLAVLASQIAREHPKTDEGLRIRLIPPGLIGERERQIAVEMAAALVLIALLTLLVACTNLSGLILAHAADRRKEIAIRLAIGAGRSIILRMMLTESLLIGAAGGAIGILLAVWLNDAVQAALPAAGFPMAKVLIDWRVIAFGLFIAILTTLLSALVPALRSTNVDMAPALRNESATGLFRGLHLRDVYVAIQIAVCMVLLAGAAMMVRGLNDALATHYGFEPAHAVMVRADVSMLQYNKDQGLAFDRRLLEKARALPGVEAAGIGNSVPFSIDQSSTVFVAEGQPEPKPSDRPRAYMYWSTPGFFRALGTQIAAGRDFDDRDRSPAPAVVIVNQTLADKYFGGANPVGKRIRLGSNWKEIVGVVEAGRYESIGESPSCALWLPLEQVYNSAVTLVIRSRLSDAEALAAARRIVGELSPDLPVFEAEPLSALIDFPMTPLRLSAEALTAMAALAALLCVLGLYGLLAYAVVQRRREVGIRMALGATAADVLELLLKRAIVLVSVSGACGLGLAVIATRILAQVLYGSPNIATFAWTVAGLIVISIVACLIPARRTLRTHPASALRQE
jgi:predicted permease